MRIAMVGTRGVPAQYGGFETCVEEIGTRLVKYGHDVVVYCRSTQDQIRVDEYAGMQLVHLPALHRKSFETLSHSAASAAHLVARRGGSAVDVAVVFNSANAPFVPMIRARGIPVATHVDGLEWKRSKWQGAGKRYYRVAEALAVRWSDALIADAQGIADYYTDQFGARTELIAYGAPLIIGDRPELLDAVGVRPHAYHLVVARFEPENHVAMIVEGYRRSGARLPLVVVGAAPYSDVYTDRVHAEADDRVRFLGAVWDQELLDQLYANCATYLHGHSVGGTNPSLLRAIGAGAATIAYDVSFNRDVLGGDGRYFTDPQTVCGELQRAEADAAGTAARGASLREAAAGYNWDDVAMAYDALCTRLVQRGVTTRRRAGRPTGRRRHGQRP